MVATLHKEDGTNQEVKPGNGKNFTLEEMYRLLNCTTIEDIPINNDLYVMIGDEEARLVGREVNPTATKIFREAHGITDPQKQWDDMISANPDMIVCDMDDDTEHFSIVGPVMMIPLSMLD